MNHGLIRTTYAAILLCIAAACTRAPYEFEALYEGLPFAMERVERPQISGFRTCLTDFGAVGDGFTLNTGAFEAALGQLESRGGGHLDVPEGIWLTGPISLRSGIDLHLEKGALIVFSDDPSLYAIKDLNFEGLDTRRCQPLIGADGCHDISITGEGIIEGSGDSWRMLNRYKVSSVMWEKAVENGGVLSDDGERLFPDQGYKDAYNAPRDFNVSLAGFDEEHIKRFLRPVMIGFRGCENVLLEGCSFRNSPSWNIHPVFCRNVIVKDIFVKSPDYAQNGDGIDIDACENTIVTGSSFDVGDDAVCVKSGKDEDGRRHGIPTKNLIIHGCTVYHSHGGFVIGSEMSGGVSNVKLSNCTYLGTETGLRFKSCRGRGGVVENIWISGVRMKDIMAEAIIFNLDYRGKSAMTRMAEGAALPAIGAAPVDEGTPEFRNIHIDNVICNGADAAMTFIGLPEMPVHDIHISNTRISSRKGRDFRYCRDISLDNVEIDSTAQSNHKTR